MEAVFDPVPVPRADAEWRRLLAGLVGSLSDYTGILFTPTAWRISDPPGRPHADGSVDIRGVVNPVLWLEACGIVSINAIDRKAAEVEAVLLLFGGGQRMSEVRGKEFVLLRYRPGGWSCEGWVDDEYDAWAEHGTDAAWSGAEPNAAADGGGV